MANEKKTKMFAFRTTETLIDEFGQFCEENCMDIAKRLRRYMQRDVDNWKRDKIARYKSAKRKMDKLKREQEKEKENNDFDDSDFDD